MDNFLNIFPGIMSFSQMPMEMAIARIFLIGLGFLILYLGCKDILEPLIMVPMGVGICLVNAGILMMPDLADPAKQKLGTMFLDSMVNTPIRSYQCAAGLLSPTDICAHVFKRTYCLHGFSRHRGHNRDRLFHRKPEIEPDACNTCGTRNVFNLSHCYCHGLYRQRNLRQLR